MSNRAFHGDGLSSRNTNIRPTLFTMSPQDIALNQQISKLWGGEHKAKDPLYCICHTNKSTGFMIECDGCEDWFHGLCINLTEKEAQNIRNYYCPNCREKDPKLNVTFKKKPKSQALAHFVHAAHQGVKKGKRVVCGQCPPCFRQNDCGLCVACKDMKKFGGDGKLRKKCHLRQCVGRVSDPTSQLLPSSKSKPDVQSSSDENYAASEDEDSDYEPPVVTDKKKVLSNKKGRLSHKARRLDSDEGNTDDDDFSDSDYEEVRGLKSKKSFGKRVEVNNPYQIEGYLARESRDAGGRQCLQPTCTSPARQESRYCSDDCGIKMASYVIWKVLPHRVHMYRGGPCVGDEQNKLALDKLMLQQEQNKQRLQTLYSFEKHSLHELIRRAKATSLKSAKKEEDDEEEEEKRKRREREQRVTVSCYVCDNDISAKNYLRHMDKCLRKYEGSVTYFSSFPTETGDPNVFCDASPQPNSYCKKLKYFCPDHFKDVKLGDSEVCGCPLKTGYSLFDDFKVDVCPRFCPQLARRCPLHQGWSKELIGEVQIEKLALWMSSEQIMGDIQRNRAQIEQRGGLITLLCNNTIPAAASLPTTYPHINTTT